MRAFQASTLWTAIVVVLVDSVFGFRQRQQMAQERNVTSRKSRPSVAHLVGSRENHADSMPDVIATVAMDHVTDNEGSFSAHPKAASIMEMKITSSINMGDWGCKQAIGVVVSALSVFAAVFILPIRDKDADKDGDKNGGKDCERTGFDAVYGKWRMDVAGEGSAMVKTMSRMSSTGATFSCDNKITRLLSHQPVSDSFSDSSDDNDEPGVVPRDASPGAVREAFKKSYLGKLRFRYALFFGLMFVHGITCILEENFYESEVGKKIPAISIVMVTNLVSLCLSAFGGVAIEGYAKVKEALTYSKVGRWGICAILFVFAEVFSGNSMQHNGRNAEAFRHVLSLVYLPICGWLSKEALSRSYSVLDWLALGVLSFSCMTFVLMRERSRTGFPTLGGSAFFASSEAVVTAVIVGVVASILSERILKGRSSEGSGTKESFILNKIHLDLTMWALSSILCLYHDMASPTPLFDNWNIHAWVVVGGSLVQRWLAGLTVQTFSSVSKSIVQSVAMVLAFYVEDVVLNKNDINKGYRFVASTFVIAIACTAAWLFQAGRAYDRVIQLIENQMSRVSQADSVHVKSLRERLSALGDELWKYSAVILYVLMSVVRAMFQSLIIGDSMMTPGSMAVAFNVVGCIIFNVKLFLMPREGSTGWQDFVLAWNFWKVVKFLPVGFFFAAAAVVTTSAYSMGISPALFNFIGNIWLPCAAFLGRYILRKFYSDLEWGVILMLTMATAAFGYMKSDGISGDSVAPMALVFAVAAPVCSAVSSLLSEMLLKAEAEPVSIQKIRFDFGSLFFAILLLPVQALLSMYSGDPSLARFSFLAYRPLTKECNTAGRCVDNTGEFVPFDASNAVKLSHCKCDWGVFVCWDGYMIIVLCVNIIHSILIVKIVRNFSSVHRALGDAFMLIVLYLLDTSLDDWALTFTALIIPLTALLFNQCANQLERVSGAMRDMDRGNADINCVESPLPKS